MGGYNARTNRIDFTGNPVLDSNPGISWNNFTIVDSATVPKLQPLADLKLNNLKAAAIAEVYAFRVLLVYSIMFISCFFLVCLLPFSGEIKLDISYI